MNGQVPAAGPNGAAHDHWWAAMLAAAPAHMLQQAASVASTVRATARPAVGGGAQQACPMEQGGGGESMCSPAVKSSANGLPSLTRAPQTKPPSQASDDGADDDREDSSNGERNHAAPPTVGCPQQHHQPVGSTTNEGQAYGRVCETVREQDRFLPIANVAKVMTRQLSSHGYAKIAHDAKMDMQECVTEFICFIMSQSNDSTVSDNRKTVTGNDIAEACRDMGEPPPCPKRSRIWYQRMFQRFMYVPSTPLQISTYATSHSAWRSSSCSLSNAVGASRSRTTRQAQRSGVAAASRTRSTSGSASPSSCISLPSRRPPRIRPPFRPVAS